MGAGAPRDSFKPRGRPLQEGLWCEQVGAPTTHDRHQAGADEAHVVRRRPSTPPSSRSIACEAPIDARIARMLAMRLAVPTITPLGCPVDPLVYCRKHTSSVRSVEPSRKACCEISPSNHSRSDLDSLAGRSSVDFHCHSPGQCGRGPSEPARKRREDSHLRRR
eukprot:scaffold122179_cov27-Tisochrysis_lutea.AAC.7